MSSAVRTRIAPSPTGEYHIGHLRTCLYDYALAQKNHGQFIVRLENTDQKRYVPGSEKRILQDIRDYGLSWDEGPDIGGPYGPYVQTERLAIYQKYIRELLAKCLAYYCFCPKARLTKMRRVQKSGGKMPKYDRRCRSLSPAEINRKIKHGAKYVIRLKVPDNQSVSFNDQVRGKISFSTNDIDDQVLIKSDGLPTYHFAVVVDDHLMKISHIFRGEEWISSTPKQILLYRYFDWPIPKIAHLTVLMDPSGHGKMAKRRGSVSARSFLDQGYLPEALLNFLMLLGWNPGDNREFFTLEEFVKAFDIKHLHKKSPTFDQKKLDYFNGHYLRQKNIPELEHLFHQFLPQATPTQISTLVPILKDRIVKLSDLVPLTRFLFSPIAYDPSLLLQRQASQEQARDILTQTRDLISTLTILDFHQLQTKLLNLIAVNSYNTGQFFMILRVAICGSPITPPLVECLPLLGRDQVLDRLNQALSLLN